MPKLQIHSLSIFMPLAVIFFDGLPDGVMRTWERLYALAEGRLETQPFNLRDFAALAGKRLSTIYGHMAALRDRGFLRWYPVERGRVIVVFPKLEELPLKPDWAQPPILENHPQLENPSQNAETPPGKPGELSENSEMHPQQGEKSPENLLSKSGNPSGNLEMLTSLNHESLKDRSLMINKRGQDFQDSGSNSENLEADFGKSGKPGGRHSSERNPILVYRSIARISLNPSQREAVSAAVSDLDLWEATVKHWLSHRWNPRNLPGMIDLYSRGGPAGCRSCQKPAASPPKPGETDSLDAPPSPDLDEMFEEWLNG